MIHRIYVEKQSAHRREARALAEELRDFVQIASLKDVRILHRYDVEGVPEDVFRDAIATVFSDPTVDQVWETLPNAEHHLSVEPLPGQFDQRADSAALCLRLLSRVEAPQVKTANIYLFSGSLSEEDLRRIRKHLINPVESREASDALPETLQAPVQTPGPVPTMDGFIEADAKTLDVLRRDMGLAMDDDDLLFCQAYFRQEKRNPTETEIRMIDTYWSDHCRHTTFRTIIDDVSFADPLLQKTYDTYLSLRKETGDTKPICLMDMALLAARALRQNGKLTGEDVSEEINACTVHIDITIDGKKEPWLLLFKNETHNHPTEIEPFGGASTCIGGAIRDPLSGRSYVYAAMRVTGAADPRTPLSETLEGKLPQRQIVTEAAQGYASYGNQIGLATGMVHEIYHPGYAAKRMEIGAVVAATPQKNVVRETPKPGDIVILLGGRTGRDGVGGATGSSKAHNLHSVETAGAEVQKGNAPEERKLQRFFRNGEAARMIKRCNDFGAGGVSVAIGEMADGIFIHLDRVPKKYEGLTGTELAISESQERMAVVIAAENEARFLELAAQENLEATVVAEIQANPRLQMEWKGQRILDLSREFLDSNGAEKHISIPAEKTSWSPKNAKASPATKLSDLFTAFSKDLQNADRHGLVDRFDSTIGAGTVLMPYGGTYRATPIQAMVHQISLEEGETDTASYMSWAFSPEVSEKSPYHGAYLAVVESLAKLLATGADRKQTYLTFQEYFKRPGTDGKRWAEPLASVLGALQAQLDLEVGSIGGKDSMSGTFESMDVPPTLVSFAITTDSATRVLSSEWKNAGDHLLLLTPQWNADGLPEKASLHALFHAVEQLTQQEGVHSAWALGYGGLMEALLLSAAGNRIGAKLNDAVTPDLLTQPAFGSFLISATHPLSAENLQAEAFTVTDLGTTTKDYTLAFPQETIDLAAMEALRRSTLEDIFPTAPDAQPAPLSVEAHNAVALAKDYAASHPAPTVCSFAGTKATPRVVIPVFPGTNCEVDSARYVTRAGLTPHIQIIRNQTTDDIAKSVDAMADAIRNAQILFLPGGFSGGDEPDGSAKLINAFFRNARLAEALTDLMDRRGGLILGICNGFQALVKLGLLPYGRIMPPTPELATLTFNTIGRHQSQVINTRIVTNRSPWLSHVTPGDLYRVPISHGEGRLDMDPALLQKLFKEGQVAGQYVDRNGEPSMDIAYNPNGSQGAVEALLSPDGRILGKMGHSERTGRYLYQNLPEVKDLRLFEAAKAYFKKN